MIQSKRGLFVELWVVEAGGVVACEEGAARDVDGVEAKTAGGAVLVRIELCVAAGVCLQEGARVGCLLVLEGCVVLKDFKEV